MAENPFDEIYKLIPNKRIENVLWILSIILIAYAFFLEDDSFNLFDIALFIGGVAGGLSFTSRKVRNLKKDYENPGEYIDDRGITRLDRPGFTDLEKALPKIKDIGMFFGISILAYAYGSRRHIESYVMFSAFLGIALVQLYLWIVIMYKKK